MLLLSNLAYVAAEKTDGFWEDNLHIFDKTTSILMLREAGVFVTDKEGSSDIFRKKNIIACNKHIRLKLEKNLKKGI
ncbi:inositol monophosphatase family protein [Bartonella sp. TT121SHDZB]|uniref:inositol monophosphatase family protein n=1 Tax=Bartonella sp. TT121SHDZB TaxID=3243580 RepID=UPI0035D0AB06